MAAFNYQITQLPNSQVDQRSFSAKTRFPHQWAKSQPQISSPHHLIAEQVFGGVFQNHSAALHDITAVGNAQTTDHVLLDDQHCDPPASHFLDLFKHLFHDLGREAE